MGVHGLGAATVEVETVFRICEKLNCAPADLPGLPGESQDVLEHYARQQNWKPTGKCLVNFQSPHVPRLIPERIDSPEDRPFVASRESTDKLNDGTDEGIAGTHQLHAEKPGPVLIDSEGKYATGRNAGYRRQAAGAYVGSSRGAGSRRLASSCWP